MRFEARFPVVMSRQRRFNISTASESQVPGCIRNVGPVKDLYFSVLHNCPKGTQHFYHFAPGFLR